MAAFLVLACGLGIAKGYWLPETPHPVRPDARKIVRVVATVFISGAVATPLFQLLGTALGGDPTIVVYWRAAAILPVGTVLGVLFIPIFRPRQKRSAE